MRLYIDKPEGVDLGDCEYVSREASAALDVADLFSGSYRLEISSPGLDRPLAKPEHFRRFAGNRVRIQLRLPIDGKRRFVGRLLGLEDGSVLMEVDGRTCSLPLEQVEKARIVPEYGD
jgi:ribosome maturation factor RimP